MERGEKGCRKREAPRDQKCMSAYMRAPSGGARSEDTGVGGGGGGRAVALGLGVDTGFRQGLYC